MLRTVARSVRAQQVGEEWLGAQEPSELPRSDRSTLIEQVMRARDGKGAAAARVYHVKEGEQLHAGALAARSNRGLPECQWVGTVHISAIGKVKSTCGRRLGPDGSYGRPSSSISTTA